MLFIFICLVVAFALVGICLYKLFTKVEYDRKKKEWEFETSKRVFEDNYNRTMNEKEN